MTTPNWCDIPEPEQIPDPWTGPETSLLGRYEDDATRLITFAPGINQEIAIRVGDAEPIYVDALDLLRVTSHVALRLVYPPSPTEQLRFQAGEQAS